MAENAQPQWIHFLRWCLTPIVSGTAWFFGLSLGLLLRELFQSLCPVEDIVSEMCHASWFPFAEDLSLALGSASIALFAILFACCMAPSQKLTVAYVVLALGALCALTLAIELQAWLEFFSALIAGMATVVAVMRWHQSRVDAK